MSVAREQRMTVSVVICAYTEQRWDDVLAAVASVRRQSAPAEEILVVVDHNPVLLERLRVHLPDVVVVANRQATGLSGARNTAVALATTDLIAFLDDDAVADRNWLAHLLPPFADDAVAGVGGTTVPLWATGRPRWLPAEFDWVLGCTFTGREPGRVRNLLGGNACFRRRVFDRAGGFPSHIGRTARDRRPLGCEETEFCIRVGQLLPGTVFLFEPRAVIGHRVPEARERFGYFRARCYAEGLSKAAVTRSVGAADGLSVERGYAAVTLRRGVVRGLADACRGDLAGLERSGAIVVGLAATTAGYLRGTLAEHHGGPSEVRRSGAVVGA